MPPMAKKFLPTQEWSVGVTGVCRRILALLATYDCEIPAYAGMVLWGNGELWADLALLSPYCRWRAIALEIPAYAGMVWR